MSTRWSVLSRGAALVAAALALALAPAPVHALVATTKVANYGGSTALSADGRWLAFSTTSRLLPADTNTKRDVYLKDLKLGTLSLVSDPAGPAIANGDSDLDNGLGVSIDGQHVVFTSAATNLVAGDVNGTRWDVFRWTRASRAIEIVSARNGCSQSGDGYSKHPRISGDGRYVTFQSASTNLTPRLPAGRVHLVNSMQVLVRDMATTTSRYVSMRPDGRFPTGNSSDPDISADGRFVAFTSAASDLVPGDSNGKSDVFRRSLVTNGIVLISRRAAGGVSTDNSWEPSISGDGRYVAFTSSARLAKVDTNPERDVYVRDTLAVPPAPLVTFVSYQSDGSANPEGEPSIHPSISADGSRIAYSYLAGPVLQSYVGVAQWQVGALFARILNMVGPSLSGSGRVVGETWTGDNHPLYPTYWSDLGSASYAGSPAITVSAGTVLVTDAKSGVAKVTVNGKLRRLNSAGRTPVTSGDVVKAWNGAGLSARLTVP